MCVSVLLGEGGSWLIFASPHWAVEVPGQDPCHAGGLLYLCQTPPPAGPGYHRSAVLPVMEMGGGGLTVVVISQTHTLVSQERLSPRVGTSIFIDLIPIMPSGEQ